MKREQIYSCVRRSLFVIALSVPQIVSAAGLWLYETGTPEMGTAGAGRGAVTNSASTAHYNPAGMTRLDESQLMVGLQPMYIDSKFSGEATGPTPPGNLVSGGNGGNAGDLIPAGGLFYAHNYSDEIKFGIAVASAYGLGLDYGDSWKGRHFVTEAELITVAMTPSVAYKVNDDLSLGLSVHILQSELKQSFFVATQKVTLESDDLGYGFGLSLLYELTPKTRFGFVYSSQVDQEFDEVSSINGIDIEMNTPQSLVFSAYHSLDDRWSLLGSLGWQDWSEFGKSTYTILGTKVEDDRNFDDTWHVSLGTHYNVSEPLTLMAGIAYDSSPVEDKYRTVDMPLDEQIRYAFGATYEYSKEITFGTAYELIDLGTAKIDQDGRLGRNITGEFERNYVHIFNVNMNYKF